jgi:hypothetical protein
MSLGPHCVHDVHTRSEVAVGATDCHSSAWHTVSCRQTRLLLDESAFGTANRSGGHEPRLVQTRSVVAVGAALSYSVAVHVLMRTHVRSAVLLQGRV